ncbi:cytokinin riboside 5'-monophosphate phosphoribohydrolase [Pseudonocardia sulfidoxydans NBRC 16205]|uniref:Cytokinin riboside 5'-monophosphate phosphoribohydrolase n=1 Tax=Pseudonocardia sulfidoxydans NBRC 16205 TaxID=1223511 RepID=A0A511DH97_9PSEU|nr:TIGR00730 family Rossman fold protein [Pseudonocardia sulfidoxydans]GEL24162.1 cytokinin riboside 5'-monophosphate phosphoribohydrolase [Pseudonocardia sulfidoxydans NBRC 16205]
MAAPHLEEPSGARFSVAVYCASSLAVPAHYLDLATDVGSGLAARGWDLVSGGGRVSMMGAVAVAARAGGSRTLGVIPRSLVDREVADTAADELVVTDTMRERKALMEAHAGAFLALPGGIGTCEELFEVWTAATLGMHDKPVVLLDPDGHWDGLLDWVRGLVDRGFASGAAVERLIVATKVTEALDACAPRHDVTASMS